MERTQQLTAAASSRPRKLSLTRTNPQWPFYGPSLSFFATRSAFAFILCAERGRDKGRTRGKKGD
jgi:hypothetical protein